MTDVKGRVEKRIAAELKKLLDRQAKVRDDMRRLLADVEEHVENAEEATRALEDAADAVSRLL